MQLIIHQSQSAKTPLLRCILLSCLSSSLLLFSGCATHHEGVSNPAAFSELSQPRAAYHFTRIALEEDPTPAKFSFQKAKGKLGSARQAILDSAEMGLSGPGAGVIATGKVLTLDGTSCQVDDPIFFAAAAGAVGGATLVGASLAGPVVGTEGLIRSFKHISPAELASREIVLSNALSHAASQQSFRAALLESASDKADSGDWLIPQANNVSQNELRTRTHADAVLEARIDELRLERARGGEDSYFLRIKTHARLVRTSDHAVCCDFQAEYRSGTALFLDWTWQGAVQSVAETGFHALAQYYVARLSSP
jgi:hypothetical protein